MVRFEPVIEATGVVKCYDDRPALAGVDLRVDAGEIHGLLGPNGAGKTTLLSVLLGLIAPDAGDVEIFGRSWRRDGVRTLDGVGGFIETPCFYPYLSGRGNLRLLGELDGGVPEQAIERVLSATGLSDRAGHRVRGYSVGMRQRLGLAATLLRDPRLVIIDEPAAGLDPAGMREMRRGLRDLADGGRTVLLASHDMAEVEELCDAVTILSGASVAFSGTIATLRSRAPDPVYLVHTTDDEGAVAIAAGRPGVQVASEPGLTVRAGSAEPGLTVRAGPEQMDDYVLALAARHIAVRALQQRHTSLEALFLQLTAPQPLAA
ncbi:MAG: ABC transporter ATP-binding protein [Mycobacteriales bacterium]